MWNIRLLCAKRDLGLVQEASTESGTMPSWSMALDFGALFESSSVNINKNTTHLLGGTFLGYLQQAR